MVLLYHILRLLVKRCKGLEIFVKDIVGIVDVEDHAADADPVFSCFALVRRRVLSTVSQYREACEKPGREPSVPVSRQVADRVPSEGDERDVADHGEENEEDDRKNPDGVGKGEGMLAVPGDPKGDHEIEDQEPSHRQRHHRMKPEGVRELSTEQSGCRAGSAAAGAVEMKQARKGALPHPERKGRKIEDDELGQGAQRQNGRVNAGEKPPSLVLSRHNPPPFCLFYHISFEKDRKTFRFSVGFGNKRAALFSDLAQ